MAQPVPVWAAALAVAVAVVVTVAAAGVTAQVPPTVKPKRLVNGLSVVHLISPASPYSQEVSYPPSEYVGFITGNLTALFNVSVTYGAHMSDVYGYLAGADADRAHDVTTAFADPTADAVLANRGGFGCTRIVDAIDYASVAANPKVFMGYSDLTTFLLAIHFRTGLVTFHGPMGIDDWSTGGSGSGGGVQPTMNAAYVQRVLFDGEAVLMRNPPANATTTLVSGKARGKLVGGNLSLLYALVGTPWFPVASIPWEQYVLFIEDVGEQPYTIDRMLTSLHLAGVLPRVAGVVWGTCTRCGAEVPSQSFTVAQVLQQKLGALSVPVFTGLLFGHNGEQFTIPIGVMAELDADAGTIQLLEPAVI